MCSLQPFVIWEEQSQGLLVVTVLPDSYGMVQVSVLTSYSVKDLQPQNKDILPIQTGF